MENLPEDKMVVDLLTKLRTSNGSYPSEMLAARRQAYLRQVANVGLGIGIGAGLKHAAKGGGNATGAIATVTSKVLETALIAAIAIEVGTVAYLYRDKIANAVRSYFNSPTTQEVAAPSDEISGPATNQPERTPLAVTASEEPSLTPSSSPAPVFAGGNGTNTNGNNSGTNINADATPDPGENNGNQYGLTPKPVRTKDNTGEGNTTGGGNTTNGGGGNGNGGGNNNGNGGGNNKP